jgi:hypothetical protein
VLINPNLIDIFMFDEKIRFYKYLPKTIKLHSISTESEFMLYLNIKKSKNMGQNIKKINFIVNSGLSEKDMKGNKSLFERDISRKLNKLILKQFFSDPIAIEFISFYIIIIKNSLTTKTECIRGSLFAIRELLGETIKIIALKSFSPVFHNNVLFQGNSLNSKLKFYNWTILVLISLTNCNIFSIDGGGIFSIGFLIMCTYYTGNFRWILDCKKNFHN